MNAFERYVAAYIVDCLTGLPAGDVAHQILRALPKQSDNPLLAEVLEEVRMSPLAVDDLRLKLKVAEIAALYALKHSCEVGEEVARLGGVETRFELQHIEITVSCQS